MFDLMSGIRPENAGPNDTAYGIVVMLGIFSFVASPVLLIAYLISIYRAWKTAQQGAPGNAPSARG